MDIPLIITTAPLVHDPDVYLPPFPPLFFVEQPVVLTSGWFVDLPKYGVLRFDYVSTSRPDHHQMPLPERRFQVLLDSICHGLLYTCILYTINTYNRVLWKPRHVVTVSVAHRDLSNTLFCSGAHSGKGKERSTYGVNDLVGSLGECVLPGPVRDQSVVFLSLLFSFVARTTLPLHAAKLASYHT